MVVLQLSLFYFYYEVNVCTSLPTLLFHPFHKSNYSPVVRDSPGCCKRDLYNWLLAKW